jgi:hypothetical protein
MGLKRQGLGHEGLAVLDPQGVDTGIPPPPGSPFVLNTSDVSTNFTWGVRAAIGYAWDNQAVELSGFYLGQSDSFALAAVPNGLSLPFNNFNSATNFPLGFEGNNGLWLQADVVRASLQTSLGDAEFNYRKGVNGGTGFQWLCGVRYVNLRERFAIFTGDDDLTVTPVDPTKQATYAVTTHNRIVAGQLGFEGKLCLGSCVAIGGNAKGAWGANFLDIDKYLRRGDGFVGPSTHFSDTTFGHVYEISLFGDLCLGEHIRIRGGYNLLWILNVADPPSQFSFNLNNFAAPRSENGSIFFHGPMVEVQILF